MARATWTRVMMVDRKSTRLNSSHGYTSYAVFCLQKNLWASEDVDRFRNESAAAHVARLGLRVAVLDVALFILELPDLDHEEVALADPHAFLQLARDPTESTLAVRAHHTDARRPEQLVRDTEDFAVLRARHPDSDDLFFGHFRVDGQGWLIRLRVHSLRKIDGVGNESSVFDARLPHGRIREGNRRSLEERGTHDVDPFRKRVWLIVHVAEPVDDRAVTEQVAVGLQLLLDVPPNLVRITEGRLRLDPVLAGAVHLERLVHQDVWCLVVLRAEFLLRLVLETAGIEPGGQLGFAPTTPGVLEGGPLPGEPADRPGHFLAIPAHVRVPHRIKITWQI